MIHLLLSFEVLKYDLLVIGAIFVDIGREALSTVET